MAKTGKSAPPYLNSSSFLKVKSRHCKNMRNYNNYNYNKNELYAQKSHQQKKKGITLRDTLLI